VIESHPLPQDDPKVRRPDITRARTTLGWEPKVAVREGLARTVAYFRTLLEAGRIESRVLTGAGKA
jgi:nucleoside-diphosphate-sugar epimerase